MTGFAEAAAGKKKRRKRRRKGRERQSAAERVEIHTHEHDGDMMRMRRVEALDLPPGERVTLAPGGLHLMIFGVERFATDRIEMVLVFDDGTEQRVTFEVRRAHTAFERKRPAEESV